MREILFRGKRTDNGEWWVGDLMHTGSRVLIRRPKPHDPINYEFYYVDPATVGQFTGLVDKHGERKFEGDIFMFGEHTYIIDWDEEALAFCAFEPFEPDYTIDLSEFSADEIAVIGNIHDNPELVEL